MNKNIEELKMLHESLSEIAILLQDSNENPVSLSLYLLDMGVTDSTVKDKLIRKTVEIIDSSDDPMKLTAEPFQKEFHKICDVLSDDPEDVAETEYILTWIGKNLIPRVYPVAMNI